MSFKLKTTHYYIPLNMKQYDSYLILGCHFPSKCIDIINSNSSLPFFNNKLKHQFNCEIIEILTPIHDQKEQTQFFLKISLEQSDKSILKLDSIKDLQFDKFYEVMEIFELEKLQPYLISIPICRLLPQ